MTSSRSTGVFDDAHYASGILQKVRRGLELGPKYYFWHLPRYFCHRRRLGLSTCDWTALWNLFREVRPKVHWAAPLPDGYDEALDLLDRACVRLTMPRVRLETLVGA